MISLQINMDKSIEFDSKKASDFERSPAKLQMRNESLRMEKEKTN